MTADVTKAYAQVQKSTPGGRIAEAEAFAKSASRLQLAATPPIDAAVYKAAVQTNQKLWTVLQASLQDDVGRLPEDLRQDILRLSIFVDKQTVKALSVASQANVDTLININRNIASGLLKTSD